MTVKDVDKGYKKRMAAMFEAAKGSRLSVGVHEQEGSVPHEGDDLTVAQIAAIHEEGNEHIPQRSWLGAWFDENTQENQRLIVKAAEAVAAGKVASLVKGLELVGFRFEGDIKKRIIAGISPELAESTILAKGSSTPLIHTTQFISSIRAKVTEGVHP